MNRGSYQLRIEQAARRFLYGTPFFFPVRSAYQRVFSRDKWLFWQKMASLYGEFVRPGAIVFDVGANVGLYSEVFCRLGATVVAVEPSAECCSKLRLLAPTGKVIVENCAAGADISVAKFHVCEESTMSTLSDDWMEAVSRSELHCDAKWLKTVEVPVTTLDLLAQRHGNPCFVKIDAEGYDDQVLAGMSFAPPALSFEFNLNGREVALKCLKAPVLKSGFVFNLTLGHEYSYQFESWVTGKELADFLCRFNGKQEYGEVFAKRLIPERV